MSSIFDENFQLDFTQSNKKISTDIDEKDAWQSIKTR
jgi:hypothetical protein